MSEKYSFLKELGIQDNNMGCFYGGKWTGGSEWHTSYNPTNGEPIARIKTASLEDYENAVKCMEAGKNKWMTTTIPFRGEIIRQIGDALRAKKFALGQLLSLEVGKIISEGEGEVQEVIDICDMACGLSRSLNGSVIPSERPDHFMMEHWNPIGLMGVITAFNFPCAVFGWNFALGVVCGNLTMWKGAPSAPLISIACTNIINEVLEKNNCPQGVLTTCCDIGSEIGKKMSEDPRIGLISFTGSTNVGNIVSQKVHARFGKTILELGGNNAVIVCDDANIELALKGCLFSAVGTCGQRCTTLRRLIIHSSKYDELVGKLAKAYATVPMGDPLDPKTLQGPLHSKFQIEIFKRALQKANEQGGKVIFGGKVIEKAGNWVEPTIIEVDRNAELLKEEFFVPILFVMKYDEFDDAIQCNNNVPQGLSSSIFTNNIQNVFKWTGPLGSDCGIVNVNIGPSGAEIGGAFGGEKATGGGRESGSDSWKQYMRRSTCTINFGNSLPLAQGVKFDV